MVAERIGVFLPCLHQASVAAGMETAHELGFKLVQPGQFPGVEPARKEWQELLSLAERHELRVSALSAYQDFGNADGIKERIQLMKSCLDLARELPSPIVITEAGGTLFADAEQRRQCWNTLVDAMRELCDYAANVGAYVAMEPGGAGLVASVESMHELLSEVDNPHLKLNLDPANVVMFGSDPVQAARELGQHVMHTHAKDGLFFYSVTPDEYKRVAGKFTTLEELGTLLGHDTAPAVEVPLGKGHVNWNDYVRALVDAGYAGPFIIERETGDDPIGDITHAKRFLETL